MQRQKGRQSAISIILLLMLLLVAISTLSAGCIDTQQPVLSTQNTITPVPTEDMPGDEPVTFHRCGCVSEHITMEKGCYSFFMNHTDVGPFEADISSDEIYVLLIKTTADADWHEGAQFIPSGVFSGTQGVCVPSSGVYTLNVTTQGCWDIIVTRSGSAGLSFPVSFSGFGPWASDFFTFPAGAYRFVMASANSSLLAVTMQNETGMPLLDPATQRELPLGYHIGSYQGSVDVQIPSQEGYLIDVLTNDLWNITISTIEN